MIWIIVALVIIFVVWAWVLVKAMEEPDEEEHARGITEYLRLIQQDEDGNPYLGPYTGRALCGHKYCPPERCGYAGGPRAIGPP